MSDDLDQDVIPVKEIPEVTKKTFEIKDDVQHRRMVFKLSRDDLEDRFLRLCEEHLLLKRHACKQEDKIKKMATKLVRLINDHKTQEHGGGGVGKRRDIETEDLIEEMQSKIRDLDRQNTLLKEKLVATKQQLAAHTKHIKLFTHSHCQAHSRSNTGVARTSGVRYGYSESAYSPPVPDYRESVSQAEVYRDPSHLRNRPPDEGVSRSINRDVSQQFAGKNSQSPTQQWDGTPPDTNFDDIITTLKEQIDILEQENNSLKKTLKDNQEKHDEVVVALKSQVNQNQKQTVYENIEIIKLQRETKQAQDKMASLLDQYNKLQENYITMKGRQERLLREIENLNFQLKEEQHRSLTLQREMKESSLNSLIITELREQTSMLQKEISVLKDSNLKLISSAISMEKERQHHDVEMNLKLQVMKLEETIKSYGEEKNEVHNKLILKTEEFNELEKHLKITQALYNELKDDYEKFKSRMAIFSEVEESVNIADIKEALLFLKTKEQHLVMSETHPPERSTAIETEELKENMKKQISQMELDHAETVAELKKVQTMLQVQYKISNEYKNEIELLNQQLYQLKEEMKTRLQEKDHMLEIRAAHSQRLEEQLKDIAYGTKSVKINKSLLEEKDNNLSTNNDDSFSGGENSFELHIKKVILSPEGERMLENENPATFLTWNFYDFELMSTPVMQGKNPVFNCSSQYNVTVDMLFLHYLNKEPMTLEYHEVIEMEYFTLATAQVRLRELLDLSGGRLHASIPLISEMNVVIGNVEYWVALKLPLTISMKYYREKSKALSYLKANENITNEALSLLEVNSSIDNKEHFNVLSIKIIKCSGLLSKNKTNQPSSYCIYKFYNWPDHDTIVIPSSNEPLYNDHKIYRVNMDETLDEYLCNKNLEFYVFDDDDPNETEYLGCASIPLQLLVKNSPIKGIFQLNQADGSVNGNIEIEMKWHFPYSARKGQIHKEAKYNKDRMIAGEEGYACGDHSPRLVKTAGDSHRQLEMQTNENKEFSLFESPLLTSTPSQTTVTAKPPVAPRLKSLPDRVSSTQIPDKSSALICTSFISNPVENDNGRTASESEDKDEESLDDEIINDEREPLDSSSNSSDDRSEENLHNIIIEIGSLTLYEGSPVMSNENIQRLFIEYEFLNYPGDELETPSQLKSTEPIEFNFKKEFDLSPKKHVKSYQFLKQALTSSSNQTRIKFTVVSEPATHEQNSECEDVGYAQFDLKEIVYKKKNFINHAIHVYDSTNSTTAIGSLTITIEALETLISIIS